MIKLNLLKHQYAFCADMTTKYVALVAGYGAGKTHAFCYKTILLAAANAGYTGAICEPTYGMLKRVLIPKMDEILDELGISYDFKAGDMKYTLHFADGDCTILCLSAENYRRMAGLNLAFFGCDEIDTIKKDVAEAMWNMAASRLRDGKVYQGYSSSTPEGFSFLYDFFVAQPEEKESLREQRKLIKGVTADNPFLHANYIPDLEAQYPPQLIAAYLRGEFVNLTAGQVYCNYDRMLNHTDKTLADFPGHPLHIGQDFNVGQCASVVHVVHQGIAYAVDEISKGQNTEQVIQIIKQRYPGRRIIIYPDASGGANKTSAAMSDLAMLKQAGFELSYSSKNPPVKDRINSMNALFCNSKEIRRYYINSRTCREYAKCLEQQAYDKNGQPDKSSGTDHMVDAGGYFVFRTFPVQGQPTVRIY